MRALLLDIQIFQKGKKASKQPNKQNQNKAKTNIRACIYKQLINIHVYATGAP